MVCGHSLEVNITTGLDFFLSVAQVQLLQQLLHANMLGAETPEKSAEVRLNIRGHTHIYMLGAEAPENSAEVG